MQRNIPKRTSGIHYFSEGWRLMFGYPGIKRYVVMPLLVNMRVDGTPPSGGSFSSLGAWIPSLMSHVPEWLQWLSYVVMAACRYLRPVLVFSYLFSTIS
jgi:CysZ protein